MADVINMETFKKRVSDTVVAQFGSLIPEEQFTAMVDKEIKAFFEVEALQTISPKTDSWGHQTKEHELTTKCTPFRAIIWRQLFDLVAKRFEGIHHDLEFRVSQQWGVPGFENQAKIELSEELEKRLVAHTPKMMAELLRNIYGGVINDIKTQIANDMRNGR